MNKIKIKKKKNVILRTIMGSYILTLTRRVNVFPHLEQTKAAGTKLGS
jgi:hypothetical protein